MIKGMRLVVAAIFLLCPSLLVAEEGKISGYMFGDYYYLVSASGQAIGAVKGAVAKNNNGFAFRRVYFQYDRKLTDVFDIRVLFEVNDAGFGKNDKMIPFVKNAYLKYAKSGKSVLMGLPGTPTWSVSEKTWGYRSIEKTIMDLHGMGSAADLGVAFVGNLDKGGRVNVHVMAGNGPGQSPEKDNQNKIYAQLSGKVSESLTLVGYADWEGQPAEKNKLTFAGFIGLQPGKFSGGLEGFLRINKNAAGANDVQVRGVSLFGSVKTSDRTRAFGRVDFFDPSDQAGNDREYLFIGGLDFVPAKDIHIMPHLWVQTYQTSGVDKDVVPRMTLNYKF